MSIKALARDLYQLQQKVEQLEAELGRASLPEKAKIENQLRKAKSEKAYLQRALDGKIGR